MDLTEEHEGTTTFFVPSQDKTDQFPPGTADIFYNPRMVLNRDATVLLLPLLSPSDYLDAMGATGVRGLRIAHECGVPVTINDRNPVAADLIRKNAEHAGLSIEVVCRDANALLSERSFDAVDLDPFGTPAPFTDAAVRGCRRFLFVTATDTAPLCGAHLGAGIRRYFARPMNTEYHSEVGLRVLLAFVARETVKYDRGVEPLFCFAREHFVRLHLRLTRGPKAADRTIDRLGFVRQCPKCAYRDEQQGITAISACCPNCNVPLQPIGPLWLGTIQDTGILEQMSAALAATEHGSKKELAKILGICRSELPTSSFYDYHRISKQLACSPPDISLVLERICGAGYPATRTHFSGYGIRTTAPLDVIRGAIDPGFREEGEG